MDTKPNHTCNATQRPQRRIRRSSGLHYHLVATHQINQQPQARNGDHWVDKHRVHPVRHRDVEAPTRQTIDNIERKGAGEDDLHDLQGSR